MAPEPIFHTLSLTVPSAFKLEESTVTDAPDEMMFTCWRGPHAEVLKLIEWPSYPKLDRGPMVAAWEESITVAGQETRLISTEMFFGNSVELLVVHLHRGQVYYVITADGIEPDVFKAILDTVVFRAE